MKWEQVALWTQVLTGMELDDRDQVQVLDAQIWQQRRQRLEQLGGPPTPPGESGDAPRPSPELLAWQQRQVEIARHQQEADAAEQAGQWRNAIVHLKFLIEARPQEIAYRERLARCWLWLANGQEAVPVLSKLIELRPENPYYWQDRGYAYDLLKQWDLALSDKDQALKLANDENRWQFDYEHGMHWARRGDWAKAAADFAKVDLEKLNQSDWGPLRDQALVRLLVGKKFKQCCGARR